MKCIVFNTKNHNYYNKKVTHGYHFVNDTNEAHVFANKWEAKRLIKEFKNKEDFIIKEVK